MDNAIEFVILTAGFALLACLGCLLCLTACLKIYTELMKYKVLDPQKSEAVYRREL